MPSLTHKVPPHFTKFPPLNSPFRETSSMLGTLYEIWGVWLEREYEDRLYEHIRR